MESTEALVVGAGINGLCSALALAEAGFSVQVCSDQTSPNTVSGMAAALVFPYLSQPADKVAQWTKRTSDVLRSRYLDDSGAGCAIREAQIRYRQIQPVASWSDSVSNYRIESRGGGCLEVFESVVADSSRYVPLLVRQCQAAGVQFVQRRFGRLSEATAECKVVVNCSGIGARELCGDNSVFPVRGQVVVVRPKVTETIVVEHVESDGLMPYVIPRTEDMILGGTSQTGDWDTEVRPSETEGILARCIEIFPDIAKTEVVVVKAGLRPARPQIRLEAEEVNGGTVVHNYGHGGSGFTLSWGCAYDVVELCKASVD